MAEFNTPEMVAAMKKIDAGDYAEAAALLIPLAETGNPKAQCNLAVLYSAGWGVEADGAAAARLYEKVAEQNIAEEHLSSVAWHNLGTLYTTGAPGIAPDPEKAYACWERAKELGFDLG